MVLAKNCERVRHIHLLVISKCILFLWLKHHDVAAVVAHWRLVRGVKKKKPNIHLCPRLTLPGLVLVGEVWESASVAWPVLLSSPFTPSWGQGVVLVCGKLLRLSCNERSQQENKALFFQSSGLDVSTTLNPPSVQSPSCPEGVSTQLLDGALTGVNCLIFLCDTQCAVNVLYAVSLQSTPTLHFTHWLQNVWVHTVCLFCCHLLPLHTFYTFEAFMWFWNY